MKITILISILVVVLLASLQQPTQGCKIRDSPHVIKGVAQCMLAKFLKLIPTGQQEARSHSSRSQSWTAPRGIDPSPMHAHMLIHTFGNHLDLVDQILDAKDEAAQKDAMTEMQTLVKDGTLHRALTSYFQEFLKQSLQIENWVNELVQVLEPEEAAELLMNIEEYVDFTQYSNITSVLCPIIANVTGWDLCATLKCLSKYDEADFEDNVRWGECFYTCQDLPDISTCVYDVIHTNCSRKPKLAPILIQGFMGFMGFENNCLYSVKFDSQRPPEGAVELYEGGPPVMVELKSYVPATVYCAQFDNLAQSLSTIVYRIKQFFVREGDCQVQFQMSLSNYLTGIIPIIKINTDDSPLPLSPRLRVCTSVHLANPKCQNNRLLTQALIGNHTHQSGASCLINITDDNWHLTHHFPLQATVDHKADRTINTNFTVKVVVKGLVSNTSKYLVSIHDRDVEEGAWSTCRSVNDPHIVTFDGKYYDNFLEGYFYLYRNKHLPYQVQVLYQNCNQSIANVTCACAVAVVSDDDVFVVDKCRRLGCEGDACDAIRTVLYTAGRGLTAGTRIVESSHGLDYRVILPHGTIVKIQVTLRQLNIHIVPSAYDRDSTEGLCGMYNANSTDDLTYPNGTILQSNGGSGFQPNEFSFAWRVPEAEQAFDGVLQSTSPMIMSNYCSCSHILLTGVRCKCAVTKLVETCDIDMEGEMNTTQLLVIQRRSLRELAAANPDMTVVSPMDTVDIDDEYRPPTVLLQWNSPGRAINEQSARQTCNSKLKDSVVGEACPTDGTSSSSQCVDTAHAVCMEDIQITDTTLWVQSAVELMKQCCQEEFDRRLHICITDLRSIENSTCLNDCSNNGNCVMGQCTCDDQWSGGDCSFSVTSHIKVTSQETVVCDRRHENCQYIPFYGTSLHTAAGLDCLARKLLVTSSGATVDSSQTPVTAPVHVVNPYQAACYLSTAGNYSVTVASATATNLATFNVLNTDLVCYRCNSSTGGCWRKTTDDHCVIDGECYEPLQADVGDNCSICNTTVNTNGWSDRQDDYCMELRANQTQAAEEEKQSNIIRAVVVSVLVIVIILLTIVIFCCQKNRSSDQEKTTNNGVNKPINGLSNGHTNGGANLTDQPHSSSLAYHKPPSVVVSAIPPYSLSVDERERTASMGSSGVQEMLRIKQLAAESQRDRAGSIGQTSVRSLGIGGGGPIHYSRFTPNVDHASMENLGIGGGHTIRHRSPSDADNFLTYQL